MTPESIKTNSALEHLDIIIADVKNLIARKQDFISFIIISLGIEFMGSFYDTYDFTDFGQSGKRFKLALSNLFKDKWYQSNTEWIYKNLRGPLIHQYRPGGEISLTSQCKNEAPLDSHLKKSDDGKIIFVLEQLFEDFKLAVQKFKNEIEKPSNPLNKEKIIGEYMGIKKIHILPEDKIFGKDVPFFPVSGATISSITVSNNTEKKKKKKKK